VTDPSWDQLEDMFHEVGSAISAADLVANCRNPMLANKLREKLRTSAQIKKITADGFELCIRALASMGATDVTIHECGKSALGEEPWSGSDEDVTKIPMRCTGTLVHDEFTLCPVHDVPKGGRR
jgi:hypothetical protein